jgi:hypothetical protein
MFRIVLAAVVIAAVGITVAQGDDKQTWTVNLRNDLTNDITKTQAFDVNNNNNQVLKDKPIPDHKSIALTVTAIKKRGDADYSAPVKILVTEDQGPKKPTRDACLKIIFHHANDTLPIDEGHLTSC